jgi:hypothetical protein
MKLQVKIDQNAGLTSLWKRLRKERVQPAKVSNIMLYYSFLKTLKFYCILKKRNLSL